MEKNIALTEEKIINITDIIGAGMASLLPYVPVALRAPLTAGIIDISSQMVVDIVNILTGGLTPDEVETVGDAMMSKTINDTAELIAEIDDETDVVKPDDVMKMLFQLLAEKDC